MSNRLDPIVESLNNLTVLEIAELSKRLTEDWGVSAAPVANFAMAAPAAPEAEVEEQSEFNVVLNKVLDKVGTIKRVREMTTMTLLDAKQFVEKVGTEKVVLLTGVSKAQAQEAIEKLKDVATAILE